MSKLLELKRSRKELVDRLDALAQNDAPTPEEETAFIDLRTQVDGMDRQIERLTYVEGRREELARVETVPARPRVESEIPRAARSGRCPERKPVENPGFENVGELVAVARFNPHDARIQALMEMDTGETGGIAIPDDINPTLREVMPQEAIMRPRATVVPRAASPRTPIWCSPPSTRAPAPTCTAASRSTGSGRAARSPRPTRRSRRRAGPRRRSRRTSS